MQIDRIKIMAAIRAHFKANGIASTNTYSDSRKLATPTSIGGKQLKYFGLRITKGNATRKFTFSDVGAVDAAIAHLGVQCRFGLDYMGRASISAVKQLPRHNYQAL